MYAHTHKGFVGCHVLAELQKTSPTTVFCVVRASTSVAGQERLVSQWDRCGYNKNDLTFDTLENTLGSSDGGGSSSSRGVGEGGRRVVVIPANLEDDQFGLTSQQYINLSQSVVTVIHVAAAVAFWSTYKESASNVVAMLAILKFCATTSNPKVREVFRIHIYPSTLNPAFDQNPPC